MLSDPVSISKFGIKLMAFYFTNSSMTQIAVRCVNDLRPQLRRLFRNDNDGLSLLPITKLLSRVTAVSLTELQLADLTKNGEEYIQCIREFVANPNNANVQTIEFRSVFMEQMREDSTLTALVSKYGNHIATNWTLRYEFSNNPYHRIVAQCLRVKMSTDTDADRKWSWTPKPILTESEDENDQQYVKYCALSLDADPSVLSEYSDDKKMEFGLIAVRTMIGQDVMDRFKLKVFIERFEAGSIEIWYRVIAMDKVHLGVVKKIIGRSSCEVGHVEINGMVLPVKSNGERFELSLSEKTMLEEYRAREEAQKLKHFQAETERLKTEWNDIEKQRVAAALAAKSERDRLAAECQILENEKMNLEKERERINLDAENLKNEKRQHSECMEEMQFAERNLDLQAVRLEKESLRIESERMRLIKDSERLNRANEQFDVEHTAKQQKVERIKRELQEKELEFTKQKDSVLSELDAKAKQLENEELKMKEHLLSIQRKTEDEHTRIHSERQKISEEIARLDKEKEATKSESVRLKSESAEIEKQRAALNSREERLEMASVQVMKSKILCMLQNAVVNWDKNEEEMIRAFCVHVGGRYDLYCTSSF